jgi:type IV secretory pathway VirB10-like protein
MFKKKNNVESESAVPAPKKKMGLIKKILIALVVILVLGAAFGGGKDKSSSKDKATDNNEVTQEQTSQVQEPESAPVEAPQSASEPAPQPEPAPEAAPEQAPVVEEQAAETILDETLIRPEFKEAMDSYEAFFDEYVETMKLYESDPSNAEALMQMSDMMSKEATMLKEFDDWEKEDNMTTAEAAYYLEVHSRIYAKLAEVSAS